MDFSAIIGILICFAMTVVGIFLADGKIAYFIDMPSVLVTIVPTFATLLTAFPMSELIKTFKHFKIIVKKSAYDPIYYIKTIHQLSETARTSGLIALESQEASISDPFFAAAVRLIVDATEADRIIERLTSNMDSITKRHERAWAIYDKGASFAPAFGMVGTLIGLINMLQTMDFSEAGGVAALGKNMSVAMVTTFYGSFMANVFFSPLGNKLRERHKEEMICKNIVLEGVLSIQRGDNPRYTFEMLKEQLEPRLQSKLQ